MAVPASASVSQLLTNFRNKTTPGVYRYFTRGDVARQIQDRVNYPGMIRQGQSSLCGPAAFLYCVAKKMPLAYAQYIIDLYESGKAKLGSLNIEPGTDTKNYDLPLFLSDMAAADWIGLAGLRDSANNCFDYQKFTNTIPGITMPGELLSWFTKAGYTSGEDNTNIIFGAKNLFTLLSAHQRQQAGHAVCLLVVASVFDGVLRLSSNNLPNHWVVLTSPIKIDGMPVLPLLGKGKTINNDDSILSKKISFDVYTWGNSARSVTFKSHDLTVAQFLPHFFGYVSAK